MDFSHYEVKHIDGEGWRVFECKACELNCKYYLKAGQVQERKCCA